MIYIHSLLIRIAAKGDTTILLQRRPLPPALRSALMVALESIRPNVRTIEMFIPAFQHMSCWTQQNSMCVYVGRYADVTLRIDQIDDVQRVLCNSYRTAGSVLSSSTRMW